MGKLNYTVENYEQAEKHLSKALDFSSEREFSFVSARIIDEVLNSKLIFEAPYSHSFKFYKKLALNLFQEAEYELSIKYYEQLYLEDSSKNTINQNYVLALLKSNNSQKGLRLLKKHEQDFNYDFYIELGNLYLNKFKLPDLALECFKSAYNKHSSNVKCISGIITSLGRLSRPSEAQDFYNEWIQNNTPSFFIYDEMIPIYVALENYNKAYICVEEILNTGHSPSPLYLKSFMNSLKENNQLKKILSIVELYTANPSIEFPILCNNIVGDAYYLEKNYISALDYYWLKIKDSFGAEYYIQEILTSTQIENITYSFEILNMKSEQIIFNNLLKKHRYSNLKM
jgi:tetratricopeptide (TPR) repeat protein